MKPNLRSSTTLRVINVYNHPLKPGLPFKSLHTGGRDPHQEFLIIRGCNCDHTMWGYSSILPQGRKLVNVIPQSRKSLLDDTSYATPTENSVEQDTNPDLSFFQDTLTSEDTKQSVLSGWPPISNPRDHSLQPGTSQTASASRLHPRPLLLCLFQWFFIRVLPW